METQYYFGYNGDDLRGLLIGCLWAGIMVAIYWLCCTQLGVDLKSVLTAIKDPGDPILLVLILIYWILLVPYIEEWFWREWMWENLYIDRYLDKIWIAITWGSLYAVALGMGAGGPPAGIACLISLAILGYLFAPLIRYEWGHNSSFLIHIGLNGGAAICWYLAGQGKF